MKKDILILGAGILLLANSTMAFGGDGQGSGHGNGGGCRGDVTCMQERQDQNKNNREFKSQRGNHEIKNGYEEEEEGERHSYKKENQSNDVDDDHAKKEAKCMQEMDDIKNGEKYGLSKNEKEYISYMREEEKIARDVYLTLYKKWGLKTFNNIATKSEQRHMDMVKVLIDKYGLEDSTVDNTVGVFKTKEFQDLYDDLVVKGSKSLADAIKVGLTIEDLDIYDLDRYLSETKNPDVKNIFQKLNKGSFNHAQAFKRQLDRNGGTYEPQFVSVERWEEILNMPKGDDGKPSHGKEVDREYESGDNMKDEGHERQERNKRQEGKGFFEKVWNFLFGWI